MEGGRVKTLEAHLLHKTSDKMINKSTKQTAKNAKDAKQKKFSFIFLFEIESNES